jgi:hypothetical protein
MIHAGGCVSVGCKNSGRKVRSVDAVRFQRVQDWRSRRVGGGQTKQGNQPLGAGACISRLVLRKRRLWPAKQPSEARLATIHALADGPNDSTEFAIRLSRRSFGVEGHNLWYAHELRGLCIDLSMIVCE